MKRVIIKLAAVITFGGYFQPAFAQQGNQITLTEIMFRPSASNSEFIELYNLSKTDSFPVGKIKIRYGSSTPDNIDSLFAEEIIPPESYAVIFEGDYDLSAGIYSGIIPADAVILKIDNKAFGSSGMSNSSDRTIYLLDSVYTVIDSVTYSADNGVGISDEKIILNPDNSQTNWGNSLIIDGTPGSQNSLSPLNFDLTISQINLITENPVVSDAIIFSVTIKNVGLNAVDNSTLFIYEDADLDSTANGQPIEQILLSNILPEDSLTTDFTYTTDTPGTQQLIAAVNSTTDMNSLNDTAIIRFYIHPAPNSAGDIVINEFMYLPDGDEPEWIELFNTTSESINLKGWRLHDRTSHVTITHDTLIINPDEYLVITDDSLNNFYSNSFSQFIKNIPSLNNGGDEIVLTDSLGLTIDSVNYSNEWGKVTGKSLEKIAANSSGTDSANWNISTASEGATPGYYNSVSPHQFDLNLSEFSFEKEYCQFGKPVKAVCSIINTGNNPAQNASLQIYYDFNGDSLNQVAELIHEEPVPSLNPEEKIDFIISLNDIPLGVGYFSAVVNFQEDEFLDNNSLSAVVSIVEFAADRNDIIISEIMCAPNKPEPEWIELFNTTSEAVNIEGWELKDKTTQIIITQSTLVIQPHQYLIIADDSLIGFYSKPFDQYAVNFPSLNNSGDEIVLTDSLHRTVDSIRYVNNWGNINGKSLEKVIYSSAGTDSANWEISTAAEGATPGYYNSVSPHQYDLNLTAFYAEENYFPLGAPAMLTSIIRNDGTNSAQGASFQIYFDSNEDSLAEQNELIYDEQLTSLLPGDSVVIKAELNNLPFGRERLIGVVVFTPDELQNNNTSFAYANIVEFTAERNDIVLNEIMFEPESPEPEWIELFNRSDKSIDLTKFKISDGKDTTSIDTSGIAILPGEYLLISKESIPDSLYKLNGKIIISPFPLLNNSGDTVILLDSLGRTIDSVKYNGSLSRAGKSLERIDSETPSGDSSNWGYSLDPLNATPLKINSLSIKDYDAAVTSVKIFPEIPYIGGNVDISVTTLNKGKRSLSYRLLIEEDTNSDSLPNIQLFLSDKQSIEPGDSNTTSVQNLFTNIKSPKNLIITAINDVDQDTSDNKIYFSFTPSYPPDKITINEFMMYPAAGEPEWVELLNISADTIDIYNWTISDVLTHPNEIVLTSGSYKIPPMKYLIIAKDSAIYDFHKQILSRIIFAPFANLNNDRDGLVLRDANGLTIDSVFYDYQWDITRGYSFEKIDPRQSGLTPGNWGLSVDIEQSTPGRINSIARKRTDAVITGIKCLPEFPAPGGAISASVTLFNNGYETLEKSTVIVSYSNGDDFNLWDSLKCTPVAGNDSITIKTNKKIVIDDSVNVKITINANDEDPFNNFFNGKFFAGYTNGMMIINELMISPKTGNPEWIELFNNSQTPLNLKNCSITDLMPSPRMNKITPNDALIPPGRFAVISADTLNIDSDAPLFIVKFGSLSAESDGLILKDFRGAVLDSMVYDKSFLIETRRSIERIDPDGESCDPMNWYPSVSPSGNTLASPNSVDSLNSYSAGVCAINEIMYDPKTQGSEYIELFNRGNTVVNPAGWHLVRDDSIEIEVVSSNKIIEPDGFFLISSDSSVIDDFRLSNKKHFINVERFSLSNSGGKLCLIDFFGNTIDSLIYSPKWHSGFIPVTKGVSLERINPEINSNDKNNWSGSVAPNGGTPLEVNSIYTERANGTSALDFSVNPFSPDGDGFEDFTIITYSLKENTAQIRLRIFDDSGRLVRTLADHKPSGSHGEIIFNGQADSGRTLRVGMYIVLLEALSESGGTIETCKKILVIAAKL